MARFASASARSGVVIPRSRLKPLVPRKATSMHVSFRARSTQDPTAAPVRVLTCPPSRCNWRSGWSESTAAMATELVTTANPRSFVSSRASARVVVPESSRMVPWPGSSANARSAMRCFSPAPIPSAAGCLARGRFGPRAGPRRGRASPAPLFENGEITPHGFGGDRPSRSEISVTSTRPWVMGCVDDGFLPLGGVPDPEVGAVAFIRAPVRVPR